VLLVHIEDAGFEALGDLALGLVGLDVAHLLDLLLLGGALDFVPLEPLLELFELLGLQLVLRGLALLMVDVLDYILLTEAIALDLVGVDVATHVPRVLARPRSVVVLDHLLVLLILQRVGDL
jgi:hypothetical protein